MMRINSLLVPVLYLVVPIILADSYPQKTLISGAVICSGAGDWNDMVEASVDQDEGAAGRLLSSGKCRIISPAVKVNLIEPEERGLGP